MQKLILLFLYTQLQAKFTLMLDPAGNSEYVGRVLQDCYERGATLQFCNQLKSKLEETLDIRVIITRVPGEPPSELLQNANFCNRLNADLYLSIHFCFEKNIVPKIWIYYFKNENFLNNNVHETLAFYPYDKIWMVNFGKTKSYSKIFEKILTKTSENKFDVTEPIAIPFKPLIGIKSPALGLEMEIKNSSDAQKYLNPIMEAICYALQQ